MAVGIFIEGVVASIKRLQLRISLQIWFPCRCTWATKKNPSQVAFSLVFATITSIPPTTTTNSYM